MSVQVSVVVPFFNEGESVKALYDEVKAVLVKLGVSHELVFVDDGSTDDTWTVLESIARADDTVKAVHFRRNFGQTAAMSAGIEHSRGDIIIPMDGDLQNDPADIPALMAKMNEGYECVSGWRKNRQDEGSRVLPSKVANWLISRISGIQLHDYGCSLKAYRRRVLEGVRLYGEMHRFIPIYASWQGARVTELVVNHRARQFGRSKYGFNRILKVVLDLMVVKFLFNYLTKPIYVFGGFGLMFIFASFAAFALALYYKFTGQKTLIQTPLPLFSAMSFMVGCLSILLGFIAEVLVRTYYESQGTRPYLVAEVLNQAPKDRG